MNRLERRITKVVQALPNLGHWGTGIIYVAMGLLASLTAVGFRNHSADVRGSLLAVKDLPAGDVVLVGLLICLGALSTWRILQAVLDLEEKGGGWKGLWHRMQFILGASVYLGVSWLILKILFNAPGVSVEETAQREASQVNAHQLGWMLMVGIGIGIFGAGLLQIYRCVRGEFKEKFRLNQMSAGEKKMCFALGRVGHGARGIILGVIGYFCIRSGAEANGSLAHGQAGVMRIILKHQMGMTASLLIGMGLISFGLFEITVAKYGQLPNSKLKERVHDAVK